MFSFEKLYAWQDSMDLVNRVYALLKTFPREEQFALTTQLRRSVISVPSNIAEGNGRFSALEQLRFFEIAYGSLMEAFCQLTIARNQAYISQEDYADLKNRILEIAKSISGLCRHRQQSEQNEKYKIS